MPHAPSFILTLSCPDRRGIVHAVTGFLLAHGGNINEAAQYNDDDVNQFFMRIVFSLEGDQVGIDALREDFAEIATSFDMRWQLVASASRMPTVILVSKLGHCLHDLLLRWHTGLLPIDIKAIVSNHPDFASVAASYGLPFHCFPVNSSTKGEAEEKLLGVIETHKAELVVLARYMQVLSDGLCRALQGRAINIHHSFLPGFKGAKPYHQAHDRGVKIIGATAHYVTSELDEGPIIEQDVARADHAMSPEALTALGRDVESVVLARAVKWHAEHRVIPNGVRTVVFR